MIVTIAALLYATTPTDGLALPIRFLDARKYRITVGKTWDRGLFDVTFEYKSEKTIPALTQQFKALPDFTVVQSSRLLAQFSRRDSGVDQDVTLERPTQNPLNPEPQTAPTYTLISITERPYSDQMPQFWYRAAISPKPPVPLIEVPFLDGVKTQTVTLTSLERLTNPAATPLPDRTDSAIFTATLPGPSAPILTSLDSWAKTNGYTKVPGDAYFRPNARLFEISAAGDEKRCVITLWTTTKKATIPVIWGKY